MHRLYKSGTDKVFDGVCGGIGEFLDIDPVIIRLVWIMLVIFGGTGLLAYLVAMILIPRKTDDVPGEEIRPGRQYSNRFWGILLIIAGVMLLAGIAGPMGGLFRGVALVTGSIIWPILIVSLGVYLLFQQSGSVDIKSTLHEVFPEGNRLYRSRVDKRIAGVCGGIGQYPNIDSNIIRVLWTLATLGSFAIGILVYLALAVFLPETD